MSNNSTSTSTKSEIHLCITPTAMLPEKHTSHKELQLQNEMYFTNIYVHEIIQPTRDKNSWNTNTFIIQLLQHVSALSAIFRGTTLIQ
jgi:hypothetical protein